MKCAICKSTAVSQFLSLGEQPPSNAFLTEKDLNLEEKRYPIEIYYCEQCSLVQLGYAVDPKILFTNYVYLTSTNNSLIKNFSDLVSSVTTHFHLTKEDFVVDIGSNDGTLISNYLTHGITRILGVEPSSAADVAIKNNIPTLKKFFSQEVAQHIVTQYGHAKIVTATNVFAHVIDLHSFVEGVSTLIGETGVFISESHYLLNLLSDMEWDSIYHEHLRYYSIRPLIHLFGDFGMEVFDAEKISTHGGSIRVYACKKGTYRISNRLKALLKDEEQAGLYSKKTFMEYGKKVEAHREDIRNLLIKIKNEGKKVFGIGAPAKGNTLLNYCSLSSDLISFLVEKSSLKIGLYSPGTHIQVISESELFIQQPEYAFILSWNIADELIPKLKKSGYKGKFIVPIPKLTIMG